MNYETYRKIKSMRSFRQKFAEMINEYRSGFIRKPKICSAEKKTAER